MFFLQFIKLHVEIGYDNGIVRACFGDLNTAKKLAVKYSIF